MRAWRDRETPQTAAQTVEADLLETMEPLRSTGRLWIMALVSLVGIALVAWIVQLTLGLQVTGMRNYVSWGLYMANFVFFIGISHAGTLISAILRVTDAGWRRPITRMAEAITVFALMVGAPMVIIDMGRPDRVLNVFAHGRLQSPVLWDVVSITTYLTGSILYLYIAMIPDMPILARHARERGRSPRLVRLYEILSLGYQDTAEQRRRLGLALGAMAAIIIPVAVSVHTVVSWVFGMTLRPGWHSTIFGPYFVVGAIFSGTAAIITAMAIFRKAYHLEQYLRLEHFRHLAKLLLVLTLLYAYFTLAEYLTAWYGGLESDSRLLELLVGETVYGWSFWLWAAIGMFAPLLLLLFPGRRSLAAIVTASVLINAGMWLKRYLIVVPTLLTPYIPAEGADIHPRYFPSAVELTITAGAFAAFLLLYTLFSRLFPILSIWETAEDAAETAPARVREHRRVSRSASTATARLVLVFAAGCGVTIVAAAAAGAQSVTGRRDEARVELTRRSEDGQEMLVATVTVSGRPVSGVQVGFTTPRHFGRLLLGEDVTLADGTAAVAFPTSLPADRTGVLPVRAEVVSPEALAGLAVELQVSGARPRVAGREEFPRALWSPRAPLALLATIAFLLLCVWSTYAFVIRQLVGIHRLARGD